MIEAVAVVLPLEPWLCVSGALMAPFGFGSFLKVSLGRPYPPNINGMGALYRLRQNFFFEIFGWDDWSWSASLLSTDQP